MRRWALAAFLAAATVWPGFARAQPATPQAGQPPNPQPVVALATVPEASAAPAADVVPGGVVRWADEGITRCGDARETWKPLAGACYYPVDLGQAETDGRPLEPVQVTGQGERLAVQHLDGLEHPVSHGEPVVVHRHGRSLRVVEKMAVDPYAHGVTVGTLGSRSGPGTRPPDPDFGPLRSIG